MSELGRFGHHPDPAIDFCVEVEELEAIYIDRCNKFANPDDGNLEARLEAALRFRVGGDLHAINAKDRLHKIVDCLADMEIERIDHMRNAVLVLYDALRAMDRVMAEVWKVAHSRDFTDEETDALRKMRDALAKAEGRS